MTENSLITLYCIVDDFIHRFLETAAGKKNLSIYYGRRVPHRRMRIADKVMKDWRAGENPRKKEFFGFKLQGICTADGTIVKLCFRPGKEHDSRSFVDITEGLEGTFVTDAGYLLKEEELKKMFDSGISFTTFLPFCFILLKTP